MEEIKKAAREIILTCWQAGYSYPKIAEYFGVHQLVIARIIYDGSFSVEKAFQILDKAGYSVRIEKRRRAK